METIIVIDIGTTFLKCFAISKNGFIQNERRTKTPLRHNHEGSYYLAHQIFDIIIGFLHELMTLYQGQIHAISITGMAEAGIVLNKDTKEELSSIIPWFDTRTTVYSNSFSQDKCNAYYKKTGLLASHKYGLFKLIWCIDNYNLDKDNIIWLSICDYIAYRLTGNIATEPSFAARTYAYNIFDNCWDQEILHENNLTESNFPHVIKSGEKVGKLNGSNIDVAIAGHDHVCCSFGVLYDSKNSICNSSGTAETYVTTVDKPQLDKNTGLVYGPFIKDNKYYCMGNIPSSAQSFEWFKNKVMTCGNTYNQICEQLENLGDKPGKILFFPYLSGIGTPSFNSEFTASIMGLTINDDNASILKGIIEGINYQGAVIIDIMKENCNIKPDKNIVFGGIVNNAPWLRIKSNILGLNLEINDITEGTAIGAAGVYIYRNYGQDALDKFIKKAYKNKRIIKKNEKVSSLYKNILDRKYKRLMDVNKLEDINEG